MITAQDPATLPAASCTDEHKTLECVCPRCSRPWDAVCPHCGAEYSPDSPVEDPGARTERSEISLAKYAALARFIQSKRNSKFWWGCFLIATGDAAADGISMNGFGAQWSVGKATVSKACVEICARLGLPPSRYMRTEQAREAYRQSNVRKVKAE